MKTELVSEAMGKTPATQNFRVVLHQSHKPGEWVTHMENLQDNGEPKGQRDFYWGHYFESHSEALQDYVARCRQYKLGTTPNCQLVPLGHATFDGQTGVTNIRTK